MAAGGLLPRTLAQSVPGVLQAPDELQELHGREVHKQLFLLVRVDNVHLVHEDQG